MLIFYENVLPIDLTWPDLQPDLICDLCFRPAANFVKNTINGTYFCMRQCSRKLMSLFNTIFLRLRFSQTQTHPR